MGTGGGGGGTAAKMISYGIRLRDRVSTSSLERTELTGIFVLTGQEAKEDAGPAVVLSFTVSGVSAMLSVFCYIEFAVEIPVVALHHNC